MSLRRGIKVIHMLKRLRRVVFALAGLAAAAFACVVLALQFSVLPHINDYRDVIAGKLAGLVGAPVSIGRIEADWLDYRPHLHVHDFAILDARGQPALRLEEIRASVAWLGLLSGGVRLHELDVERPHLVVERDASGRLWVGGVPVGGAGGGQDGFADWLLAQRHVLVRDADVTWIDRRTAAPPLVLRHASLDLGSFLKYHTFTLDAAPPERLAAPLRVTGKVLGRRLSAFNDWQGHVAMRVRQADLAALRPWWPSLPLTARGDAALSVDFIGRRLKKVNAEVALAGLSFAPPGQAPVRVDALSGDFAWQQNGRETRVVADRLTVDAGGRARIAPSRWSLLLTQAKDGAVDGGTLTASHLSLGAVSDLSRMLPVLGGLRGTLADLQADGDLDGLSVKWSGAWRQPEIGQLRARFTGLGIAPLGAWPGVRGATGTVAMDSGGGALTLAAKDTVVSWPRVFASPLTLDSLSGKLSWTRGNGVLAMRADRLDVANRDVAGSFSFAFSRRPGKPDFMDLHGRLARASATAVVNYLPTALGAGVRDWLRGAVLKGTARNVDFTVRGEPARFPFENDAGGVFQISAPLTGGVLQYVPSWPRLTDIDANLLFRGTGMLIDARSARTMGVAIGRTQVRIPSLTAREPHLLVNGEAAGPTQGALNFVTHSPVNEMLYGVATGVSAVGNGQLRLALDIPLFHADQARFSGGWQFLRDDLRAPGRWPDVAGLTGQLRFDNNGMALDRMAGQALGGPVALQSKTVPGGTQIVARGHAQVAAVKRWLGQTGWDGVTGAADYGVRVNWRHGNADVTVNSPLRGVASTLPYPLAKRAGDSLPLSVEVATTSPTQDLIRVDLDHQLSVNVSRRLAGGEMAPVSAAVGFNQEARADGRPGLWAQGRLRYLNLDQWRALLPASAGGRQLPLAGLRLDIAVLDAYGRRFNNVAVSGAGGDGDRWHAQVASNEMAGEVDWLSRARQLRARLSRLAVPASVPSAAPAVGAGAASAAADGELPSVDLTAASFRMNALDLGSLHLALRPDKGEWRIDDLALVNPDGRLRLTGETRPAGQGKNTQVDLSVDSREAGKLLARLGYPDALRDASVSLAGHLSWPGDLAAFDLARLSGTVNLDVGKGRFLKIDPGAGKLLGVLSLQSLPRRLTLDFRDVFSGGFSFDRIEGRLTIRQGVLHSDNFSMVGPAARVTMSGDANLADRSLNLRAHILPDISDGLSVAGAFAFGPVTGLSALVLQKVLKNPIDHIVAYDYMITGSWDNPTMTKLGLINLK